MAILIVWPVMLDARHHRREFGPEPKGHHRRRTVVASLCGAPTLGIVRWIG